MKLRLLKTALTIVVLALLLLVIFGLVQELRAIPSEQLLTKIAKRVIGTFYFPVRDLVLGQILTVGFVVAVALTLILERWIPANPRQKVFSVSFAQDFVWYFYEVILLAAVFATYVSILGRLYDRNFSALTITSVNQAPGWVKYLIAFLMLDLLGFIQHVVNHKVPFLWRLHAVHHSQKELNFFSDFRYHILEYVVRYTFISIPFLILRFEVPVIIAFVFFRQWYSRMYHGNIRTNLGPLRYILVTPQSHRVHHSVEAEHRDKNFGSILSIWDRIFGTQHPDYNVYPATGIGDEQFPHEKTANVFSLLWTPVRQMLYAVGISRKPREQRTAVSELKPQPVEEFSS